MRRRALLAASQPSESGLTFPITLVEGDNGQLGKDFCQYVLNGNYTDNNIVYLDWHGFIMIHQDWGPPKYGTGVGSYTWEVVEEYDPIGSPNHYGVVISKDGILSIYIKL